MPYKDKQKNKEHCHQYYLKNRERILKQQKKYKPKYYQDNKERINTYCKECRKLYTKRRAEYMANKSCPYCGSTEDLVLHHLFPRDSVLEGRGSDAIWGWRESRQIKELLKCLVVCRACHSKIHAKDRIKIRKGGIDEWWRQDIQ